MTVRGPGRAWGLALRVVVGFLWAYLRNLCDGKSGTDAIPLYDYMIETWSGAGVYEPTWVKTQVVPPPRFAGDA